MLNNPGEREMLIIIYHLTSEPALHAFPLSFFLFLVFLSYCFVMFKVHDRTCTNFIIILVHIDLHISVVRCLQSYMVHFVNP